MLNIICYFILSLCAVAADLSTEELSTDELKVCVRKRDMALYTLKASVLYWTKDKAGDAVGTEDIQKKKATLRKTLHEYLSKGETIVASTPDNITEAILTEQQRELMELRYKVGEAIQPPRESDV